MKRRKFLDRYARRRAQVRAAWKRMKKQDKRASLSKLGRQFNISRERARQIIEMGR